MVHQLEEKFGYSNIAYLGLLALLAAVTDYKVFLVGTSFVHYARYISTYYHRENVAYGNFKRDVLIYKSIALAQLVVLYLSAVTNNFRSPLLSAIDAIPVIDLAMVIGGYG